MLQQEVSPSGMPGVVRRKHRWRRHAGGSGESGDRLGSLEVDRPVIPVGDLQHQPLRVRQLHLENVGLATRLQQVQALDHAEAPQRDRDYGAGKVDECRVQQSGLASVRAPTAEHHV